MVGKQRLQGRRTDTKPQRILSKPQVHAGLAPALRQVGPV
jgi:hypothetical protein